MARFDGVIDKLYKESGLALMLETGSGISMRTAAGNQPVVKTALSTQQIIGALSELVPADLRAGFPEDGVTQFPYLSPAGAVKFWLAQAQHHHA